MRNAFHTFHEKSAASYEYITQMYTANINKVNIYIYIYINIYIYIFIYTIYIHLYIYIYSVLLRDIELAF